MKSFILLKTPGKHAFEWMSWLYKRSLGSLAFSTGQSSNCKQTKHGFYKMDAEWNVIYCTLYIFSKLRKKCLTIYNRWLSLSMEWFIYQQISFLCNCTYTSTSLRWIIFDIFFCSMWGVSVFVLFLFFLGNGKKCRVE